MQTVTFKTLPSSKTENQTTQGTYNGTNFCNWDSTIIILLIFKYFVACFKLLILLWDVDKLMGILYLSVLETFKEGSEDKQNQRKEIVLI